MPKSKIRKRKISGKPTPIRSRPNAVKGLARKIRKQLTFRTAITVLISAIGLTSAYVTIFGYLSPRIAVQPLPTVDPRDALSSGFSVTNQGAMDLYNVAISSSFVNFKLRYVSPDTPVWNAPAGTKPHYEAVRRTSDQPEAPEIGDIAETVTGDSVYSRIGPMRSGTMRIPYSMPNEENLDILIVVWYRPAWYPFKRYETFRFVTRTAVDGQIHWVSVPD